MISRGLILSLGTTATVSVLLFIYFRSRMSSVENKVSMLFKLIEDHHAQQQVQFMEKRQDYSAMPVAKNEAGGELINVSDDDTDDSDEDSESESGYGSDEMKISIQNEQVKKIEISNPEDIPLLNEHNSADRESLPDNELLHDNVSFPDEEQFTTDKPFVGQEIAVLKIDEENKPDYTSMKIKELKQLCSKQGLTKYSHLNKAGLVNLLQES